MIYRVTFTHGPDYEFILASVRSMRRLRAWSSLRGIFLFMDPSRPFTLEQLGTLRDLGCTIWPTPLITGTFTGVTFNWSWEGIYDQILAYKWLMMNINLDKNDYVMRADSDTVFTSSRFLNYTTYGGHYIGKGNEQTWDLPGGPFRPTEGPCVLMNAETFVSIGSMWSQKLQTLRQEWALPLVDDVFYSYCANLIKPITLYENAEWYTGTTKEEFEAYLANSQLPGAGFLFHWLGHLKHPVKEMLGSVNWLPEP